MVIVVIGMLAALWSGFFIGFYKRENKAFEIPKPFKFHPPTKEKALTKEEKKANSFYN